MSYYVNKNNDFDPEAPIFRECPHCGHHAQLIPVSTPRYSVLAASKPKRVALGFRCASCDAPRFASARLRRISPDRIELSSNVVEIERAPERFPYTHLPPAVRDAFHEALACHTADCHTAFALMCRVTLNASLQQAGNTHPGRLRRAFHDAVHVGGVDATTAALIESLLFGDDPASVGLAEYESAVLVEIMKDVLYECHVRQSKMRAALKMRRYFADEEERSMDEGSTPEST